MRRSILGLVIIPACALAQAGPALQPGEILENGGGQQMKVLQCRPTAYRWRECETVAWKNEARDSNPAWWNEDDLIRGDARVRSALHLAPRGGATIPPRTTATAGPALTGQCQPTPYGGPVAATVRASPALFRRKIADSYTMRASAPGSMGVTFEQFEVGAPVRNTVSATAAGAARVNEGAPVGATMYPVASTYVVCEQASGIAERTRIVNHHFCFVSRDAEWICAGGGGPPPQITRLR